MSNQSFTPGKKSYAREIIKYLSLVTREDQLKDFKCFKEDYKKFSSQALFPNISTAQRISYVLKRNISNGNTQFGNYYLGAPVVFNYLGRVEGQIGGSGLPLRNKF